MKLFNASFDQVLVRYYLMIMAVVLPFLAGVPILTLLSIPLFLSAILGVDFSREKKAQSVRKLRTPIQKAA